MKAIGYIRVSTSDQADSGLSLTHQEAKIKAYCDALDINLVDVISDAGFSAKTLNRPGMTEVINQIKNKSVDAVVILKLDRLTRSVKDLGTMTTLFEKTGVALVSVQDSINTSTAARHCHKEGRKMGGSDSIKSLSAGVSMKESIKQLFDKLAELLKLQEPGAADRAIDTAKSEEKELKH